MSTHLHNGNSNTMVKPSTSSNHILELRRRAMVDKSDTCKYNVKLWLSTVNKLYEQGDLALRQHNDLDNAYIFYMKGCNIVVEIIRRHPKFEEIRHSPAYQQILKRTNNEIFGILETLGKTLDQKHGVNNEDRSVDQAMSKYPPVSALMGVSSSPGASLGSSKHSIDEITLDDLPTVPTHIPKAGQKMIMPEPRPASPQQPPSPPRGAPLQTPPPTSIHQSGINGSRSSSASSHTTSSPKSVSITRADNNTVLPILHIPPYSNNVFPRSMVLQPAELAKLITKKENPPSVLIMDIRPRDMYSQGCIRNKWICQIEPLVLRQNVSSQKIQDSLVLNPDLEQQMFAERHKFDLVVYYDQDSTSIEHASEPLKNLRTAIYEMEFHKNLPRMPVMLSGGFSAWEAAIGERGIYRATAPNKKAAVENKDRKKGKHEERPHRLHWLREVVGRSPDRVEKQTPVHHTLYDYFNYKQQDAGPQSMSKSNNVTPPLQGIFANSLSISSDSTYSSSTISMPSPHQTPSSTETLPTPTEESIIMRYPDIQPNTSTAKMTSAIRQPQPSASTSLQRRNTFIDNPFHGFTETKTERYDVPPVPAKPTRPLPPPPPAPRLSPDTAPPHRPSSAGAVAPPPVPLKPSELTTSRPSVAHDKYAPVANSSFSQLGVVTIGTTGLKNLGNTCFMSSIIQCLSGTIPLARYLISGTFRQHINKTNPLGTGGVLVDKFAELLRVMWYGKYNFISPVSFREALVRFAPQFAGKEQQDSQEFLTFLLDGIHEDVNMVVKRPPSEPEDPEEEARFEKLPDWQASAIAWEKYLARNESIIVSLFQGQYRSRLTCLTCGQTSTTYNTFMSLSLPIPAKGNTPPSVSLYQCLDYFVKEEVLENDDAWHCPRCKQLRNAKKRLTLSRLPDVLLIHLKRFSYDGPFHNKLETLVDYPTRGLDLSSYVPSSMFPPDNSERPSFTYDLYGVSNHYGSLTGGHYTAYVRNGYRDTWHYFDDTRFSVCEEAKVVSRAAYNLFYVRSTVK